MCGLVLSNLPEFDPTLFTVFSKLGLVRGALVIENNEYLYNLDFLSNVYSVCLWLLGDVNDDAGQLGADSGQQQPCRCSHGIADHDGSGCA